MKHTTPILAAVASMHAEHDAKRPCNPYNTVRPLDVIAWEAPEAPISESVTMWTDENGLDCYETTLTMSLEDKS